MKEIKMRIERERGTKPITIVQGGQWGSEAKGMVAAALCQIEEVDFAVRTGAVNAGHTVYHDGVPFKMQQLPTGWVNEKTRLVIGAGAYINPAILAREIEWICEATGDSSYKMGKVIVDQRAGLHLEEHTTRSTASDRHHLIGATGKGCSEAIVDKIKNRGNGGRLFIDWLKENKSTADFYMTDTEAMLNYAFDGGAKILIEGTQGQILDLHLGPYPYTTHKQTGPANWIGEVGLSPNLPYEIALVVRTFPIRVAGNSGPMPKEVSWENVAEGINKRLQMIEGEVMVSETALAEWEWAQRQVAKRKEFELPEKLEAQIYGKDIHTYDYQFHRWSAEERLKYKAAISEFHKAAFNTLKPEVKQELCKVFEFTTVTNKLRRVAGLDIETLKASVRQTRPNYIVLTFLNYVFPELWGKRMINSDAMDYIRGIEDKVGVGIKYVSTGPESQHLLIV